ncbi:hypothetical protein RC1_2703 [Rhodospirillum centenum SW]|uniref:Uncharacterized protein n=1 Tax=Rhodospirillum centenum (strain ATCC 51521 / SW) TaxID=414684 RepID=B6IUZ6_RHOCS|nr:hypothetical protein RC1_2703 [Rhodospirillum centenum SW]
MPWPETEGVSAIWARAPAAANPLRTGSLRPGAPMPLLSASRPKATSPDRTGRRGDGKLSAAGPGGNAATGRQRRRHVRCVRTDPAYRILRGRADSCNGGHSLDEGPPAKNAGLTRE